MEVIVDLFTAVCTFDFPELHLDFMHNPE